ncbi:hypothetical protein ACA910_017186 [Epithemia clementina (nom. ined.)]
MEGGSSRLSTTTEPTAAAEEEEEDEEEDLNDEQGEEYSIANSHEDRKLGSPLGLWSPRASPLNVNLSRPASVTHQDDLSVSLFANSFDTVSEPVLRATFDREPPPPLSPPFRKPTARSRPDIAIPDLKHGHEESDCSLGDISPIKVSYSNDVHQHQHEQHQQQRDHHDHPYPHQSPETFTEDVNWPCDSNGNAQSPVSNPFYVIRFAAKAFTQAQITYKLPCLHGADQCPVNMNTYGQIRQYKPPAPAFDVSPLDTKIATMRVEAAICAFGGTLKKQRLRDPKSIFRLKDEPQSRGRCLYDQALPRRFVLSGSRISWDFEENPPIVIPTDAEREEEASNAAARQKKRLAQNGGADDTTETLPSSSEYGVPTASPSSANFVLDSNNNSSSSNNSKIKYRCKLCGQLKNNHICPYRQPLQRSIGIMVYPALNSFTACEPGTIAPPLTTMNNFVSYDSDLAGSGQPLEAATAAAASSASSEHATMGSAATANAGNRRRPPQTQQQQHQHHQQHHKQHNHHHPTTVSPEAHAGANSGFFHSPQSSLSNHSGEEVVTPNEDVVTPTDPKHRVYGGGAAAVARQSGTSSTTTNSRKRVHDQVEAMTADCSLDEANSAKRALFVTAFPLRPEHYRSVTQTSREDSPSAYQYPTIPLTFAERKRLSDTLFILSKEIPSMTADCAVILREARAKNEWDMAVAELLTQIVVGLFCTEEDSRLEGLQRYLLTLGVSC